MGTFIDCQPAWIKSLCWPKVRSPEELAEHVLIGRGDGSVTMYCVKPGLVKKEELHHCSKEYG